MREATGNALLTTFIASIITVILIFFVGSISYSKSFKIKNYIINEIEENGGWDNNLQSKIDSHMKDVGYNVRGNSNKCNNMNDILAQCTYVSIQSNYEYCVFECGNYYKVVTFMNFKFPIIGEFIKFEVKGETNAFSEFNTIK